MKTHATGLGFDPNDSTSMSGYHAYMDRFTQGHPHASTHPASGLAWDTSSGRMWRGSHGSRTPRHQAAHEHDAAKQAWQWLRGKGHI
jgi:hypothetical protein